MELEVFQQQQQGESSKAYAAYIAYRDLGENRSLEKVSQELTKSVPLLKRWSAKYEWVARALAWDMHRQQRVDEAQLSADELLIEKELEAYKQLLERWREAFAKTPAVIVRRGKEAPNVDAMLRLVKLRREISNIGRRALGMPERIKESRLTGKGGGDLVIEFAVLADDEQPQLPESLEGDDSLLIGRGEADEQ